MSKPNENQPRAVNLPAEIEIRRALSVEFDLLLRSIEDGGLSATSPADLDSLVVLLAETIESRKSIEKQEKLLKGEVRRHFPEGSQLLDCPSAVAIVDSRSRTDLDRAAILRDFGQGFFDKYGKVTSYETLTAKVKR